MTKNLYRLILIVSLLFNFSFVSAATKPSSDADTDSLSYVFYLYYDNGQLYGDRDYQVKFDVVNEKFIASTAIQNAYKVQIFNAKSDIIKTADFDPKNSDPNFAKGKVQVKAPYVPNGIKATFSDNQGRPLMTIFISTVALCNDDNFCSAADGENDKTCPNDCKIVRPTPSTIVAPTSTSFIDGFDLNTILLYSVSGVAVIIVVWFIWRWRKKKKDESFLPPPPSDSGLAPAPPLPPEQSGL